jgi:hypothetical protein
MLIDRGRHQRHSASRQADRTGGILATVDFNMFKIGCTATRAAARYLKREPLQDKVMLPAEIINKTNYKAWLFPWISGRARSGARWRGRISRCRPL